MKKSMSMLAGAAVLMLAACNNQSSSQFTTQDQFFTNLSALCGKAYEGSLVSNDEVDADWAAQKMIIHVRDCSDQEIKIPLHVGENRSRTWIISKQEGGLRLKHDHRHEDGSEDKVTFYGGDTAEAGTAIRQEFPVDNYSIEMFMENELTASVVNVWAVEVKPAEKFAYELSRPNRFFRVEFDLTTPVDLPPAAWGYEGE